MAGRPLADARHRGHGPGLAIVRQVAQLHGGTVHVSSEPGVGSAFTLTLPGAPGSRDAVSDAARGRRE
ncbi:ATP-binding protein [Xylanimonas protaetiae]|uniref:ATP-binding protein n=1 Tax=Xylanimonas protaetiae TaxID=2509457 RepID=UPI003CCA2F9C